MGHSNVSLPAVPELKRKAGGDVEVWNNKPGKGEPPHVVLVIDLAEMHTVELLPHEARAVASLLMAAADSQERSAL